MKNLIILFFAFSLSSFLVFSQKNPPENVKKEFIKKFPSAQSVKWGNEDKTEWEAEFIADGKRISASYDNTGKWIESETKITEKELPATITNTINKDFQGYKKGEIEIFENSEMKGYELSLLKGEKSVEVIIDNNGKIIKKTDKKEKDEKNEKEEK